MDDLNITQLVRIAQKTQSKDDITQSGFKIVAQNWLKYCDELFERRKNLKNRRQLNSIKEFAEEFINVFFNGYKNRPSKKIGKHSGTKSDELINEIIKIDIENVYHANAPQQELPQIDEKVKLVKTLHRYSMSVENIIGAILEEYIHTKVLKYGWAICWGSCIRAVDLCNKDGIFFQIKNKSNTENSASSGVRAATNLPYEVTPWKRLNAKTGKERWDDLKKLLDLPKTCILSKEDFFSFAKELVNQRGFENRLFVENIDALLELQL